MAAKIDLIQHPLFTIDFAQFKSSSKTLQKTNRAALQFFRHLPYLLLSSLASASWDTLKHSGTSFKQIVFGFYGSWSNFSVPSDIYLLIFKIAFWALNLFWCIGKTTFYLVFQDLYPSNSNFLTKYASSGVDVSHIRTDQKEIDVTQIPSDVQVSDLTTWFNQVNFTCPDQPGYMAPQTLDGSTSDELREKMALYVYNMTYRVAFLGTPSAYDTPALMAYYNQLHNATRSCMHALNQRQQDLKDKYGVDTSSYTGGALKAYQYFVEDRNRFLVTLAIAGKYCGARYMGEAMGLYQLHCRGSSEQESGTLQSDLVELLAKARYELVIWCLGSRAQNTHAVTAYLQAFSKPLGLPGTAGVIEHLTKLSFETREAFLKAFFTTYTEDFIIEKVQEEFKRSAPFQQKVFDWIKDQVKNWAPADALQSVDEIADQMVRVWNGASQIDTNLQELIGVFREAPIKEAPQDWNAYLNTLFHSDCAKAWRDAKFSAENQLSTMQKMASFKTLCASLPPTRDEMSGKTSAQLIDLLLATAGRNTKLQEVRKISPLPAEVILRHINCPANLKEALSAQRDQYRRNEFLAQIAEQHVQLELSPALLEWLLVAQGVFKVQEMGGV